MSDEDDWPAFVQVNVLPIIKGIDAMVAQQVDELINGATWDIRELEG